MPKKSKKPKKITNITKITVRRKLINKPVVKGYKDFPASGLIRVLDREKDKFPEFALTLRARNTSKVEKSLKHAGLKQEEAGKWVLRTDTFSIFVYT